MLFKLLTTTRLSQRLGIDWSQRMKHPKDTRCRTHLQKYSKGSLLLDPGMHKVGTVMSNVNELKHLAFPHMYMWVYGCADGRA